MLFPKKCRLALVASLLLAHAAFAAGELRFCLRADPKTFDPLLAAEEASETIRYITGGVLIRLDRGTQKLVPELAESWKVTENGAKIEFVLRKGVRFSDGTPFDSADVVATVNRLNNKDLVSAVADTFHASPGRIEARAAGKHAVSVRFPAPIAGLETLFDQLPITSSRSKAGIKAVLGPFSVADYRSGQYVLLQRNPFYWKPGLPHLESVRLDIQSNREIELMRFRRGEIHLVEKLEPEAFGRLKKDSPSEAIDAGPSLNPEFLWFNQAPGAPVPAHKAAWFASRGFRRAISAAIQRDDIVRVVYRGYAVPAGGHISSANRTWWNPKVRPQPYDLKEAMRLLEAEGFRTRNGKLFDSRGNAVEFSLITNAGSRPRTQMAAVIQQDLGKIGIDVKIAPLEFGSLVDRIMKTRQYEACLLGLNTEAEPATQYNVWLSSGNMHAWNAGQPTPATPWEAEIDRLIQSQGGANFEARRKAVFRIQEIFEEQAPLIYLVHPNVLVAVSRRTRDVLPSAIPPHLYWNIDSIRVSH